MTIIFFMTIALVVVAGTCLAEFCLDEKTIGASIFFASIQSLEYFNKLAIAASEFQRTCFQLLVIATKYDAPVAHCLNRIG